MIYDEQSSDDARAQFAERRIQKLDAAAEAFLANEAAPELKPLTRWPVRLRWTAQGELFQGDE